MPIYAYKCESCGFAKDVLQKISDAPLSDCPNCGAPAFKKQLTAAGFQLKGSGWYVTDFRGGSSTAAPAPSGGADSGASKAADTPAPAAAAAAPAASPAPSSASSSSSSSGGSSSDKGSN
jgi:putative FmdB family regulatory protein